MMLLVLQFNCLELEIIFKNFLTQETDFGKKN